MSTTTKKAIMALEESVGMAACYHEWSYAIFDAISKYSGYSDDVKEDLCKGDRRTVAKLAEIAKHLLDDALAYTDTCQEEAHALAKAEAKP